MKLILSLEILRISLSHPANKSSQVSVRIFLISFLVNTYVTNPHIWSCKASVSGASVFLFIGALSIAPSQGLNHMHIHTRVDKEKMVKYIIEYQSQKWNYTVFEKILDWKAPAKYQNSGTNQ